MSRTQLIHQHPSIEMLRIGTLGLVVGMVGLGGTVDQAHAEPAVLGDTEGWRKEITAYLFAPVSTEGTSAVAGQSAEIDLSLSDALDVLDFTISGRFEAWLDDFGVIFEGSYLGISEDQTITGPGPAAAPVSVSVDVEQSWFSLLGGYRLATGSTDTGKRYSVDVAAGARYNYLKQEITISGPPGSRRLGGSESWFEPAISARGALELGSDWTGVLGLEASGFGVEGNDLTWSTTLAFDWALNEQTAVKFGYRYFSIDYETTKSDGLFKYDVSQHGPFIGMSYRF
ncbi:hypothetical protein ROA7450_03584 [Roseovarius albus]|uniref:Uncharacterized protein n=1 Tax=Roseovarius albus TaxID=1247867 RepID=A0A1X7A119_9RHOB|nr:outer membrane beta-barrel protein [Roseovarius albus]SLN67247.1 hypothetical protein ROA7450_03584 [Roseovarius albus]